MRFSTVSSDSMFSNVFTRKANRVTSTNIVGEVRLYDSLEYHFNQDFGRAIYINNQFASNGTVVYSA